MSTYPFQVQDIIDLTLKAGQDVMRVYAQDFAVYEKEDKSPVTDADIAAEKIIFEGLSKLTSDIPILGEEHIAAGEVGDLTRRLFWLVDPIDGTAEFVKRNGEFTVNIGLIDEDRPVFGIVYAPVSDTIYYTDSPTRAIKMESGLKTVIKARSLPSDGYTVLVSRTHYDADVVKKLLGNRPISSLMHRGSSLKFCAVAEGEGDIYPCSHPTHEWDTAAAHAILKAAGGEVFTPEGIVLTYRKKDLQNPAIIALGTHLFL